VDGTIGDTGRELGGYDAIEAASQDLWSVQRRSSADTASVPNSGREEPPPSGRPPPCRTSAEAMTIPAVKLGEPDSD
jgi:hypothetical protein